MINKPIKDMRTEKQKIQKAIDSRYQQSISNIEFSPDKVTERQFKRIKDKPYFRKSGSLEYNAKETEEYLRTERARKAVKFTHKTPQHMLVDALVETKLPTPGISAYERARLRDIVEKAVEEAKDDPLRFREMLDFLNNKGGQD